MHKSNSKILKAEVVNELIKTYKNVATIQFDDDNGLYHLRFKNSTIVHSRPYSRFSSEAFR